MSAPLKTFDAQELRSAFSHFPTGVCVVTGLQADNMPFGLTVSSFQTLSLDPALVLFSVQRGAASLGFLAHRAAFAVNILRESHGWMARQFASRCPDRFANVAWAASGNGNPLLTEALAHFECVVWNTYEGGDHVIVIGHVQHAAAHEDGTPLIFHRGAFLQRATPEIRHGGMS
ncbi:flavin reductase family protein [Aestuariivirga sp.]|uniref:flavin reductase family protein n=1 Tax=Aestuariivirga sp. TaxID=2650926 RepID=UPI0039E33773